MWAERRPANLRHVTTISYAVTWCEPDRTPLSGRLELRTHAIHFEGAANGRPVMKEVPYAEVEGVHIGRESNDRIGGRPALVVERTAAPEVRVASIIAPGILSELAEQIAGRHLRGAARTLAVLVRLRDGSHDAVRELLATGPPFDPRTVGLTRHQVFLTETDVVFLFEVVGPGTIEELLRQAGVWASAEGWLQHVASPPRIAERVYDWSSPAS